MSEPTTKDKGDGWGIVDPWLDGVIGDTNSIPYETQRELVEAIATALRRERAEAEQLRAKIDDMGNDLHTAVMNRIKARNQRDAALIESSRLTRQRIALKAAVRKVERERQVATDLMCDIELRRIQLEREEERLRESLEFYANAANYEAPDPDEWARVSTEIDRDAGQRARAALAGEKGE